MEYINKSAVVAEIKTRIETYNKGYANGDDCRADALEIFLHDIDTIEVKDVDLENEINLWVEDNTCRGYCSANIRETAEHFFELGLKAQMKHH